jgi:beta-glucanase (GH16 family)
VGQVGHVGPLGHHPSSSAGSAGSLGEAGAASDPSASSAPGSLAIPASSTGWKLTFDQEFDGTGFPQGWHLDGGGNGFGDKELQYFQAANVYKAGGVLNIVGRRNGFGNTCWYGPCQYSSAEIDTTGIFSQTYGLFEASIKIPNGTGLWPAFWLLGNDNFQNPQAPAEEIDILEVNGSSPYVVGGYAHAPNKTVPVKTVLNQPTGSQFHTYAIEWTPTVIIWLLDGQQYAYMNAYPGWTFNRPMSIILDLAIGGTWPGSPTPTTPFPAYMSVDWVRAYHWGG